MIGGLVQTCFRTHIFARPSWLGCGERPVEASALLPEQGSGVVPISGRPRRCTLICILKFAGVATLHICPNLPL